MADTTFSNGTVVEADWLNDVNDLVYNFIQSGTGAVARTAQDKLREAVSIKDFGAVCDGVTDDSAARTAAFDYCIANKRALIIPGLCRVTSGYRNNTTGGELVLIGENTSYSSGGAAVGGSGFVLDSTDTASYFYWQSAQNELIVQRMRFACAQNVLDRKFFRTSAVSVKQTFSSVHFSAVERPIVFESGTYFQMSSYRDIRFTNSGSFHSEAAGSGFSSGLLGTLLILENVDVEGACPERTEKIICDLSGIRHIRGTNVLIEPSTPSAGWTGLKISNPYDPAWTRYPLAVFNGFYMEVTGSGVSNVVDQSGGNAMFISTHMNMLPTSTYAITDSGSVSINGIGFTGTNDPVSSLFALEDETCHVKLTDMTYRNPGTIITDPRFTLENCSSSPNGGAGTEVDRATSFNNLLSSPLWVFDGGLIDPGLVTVATSGGTTYTPTVNAAFGRALKVAPSSGAISLTCQAKSRASFQLGAQFFVVLKVLLPTISSGAVEFSPIVDGVVVSAGRVFTSADSGGEFDIVMPMTAPAADPSLIGFRVSASAAASDLLIYQAGVWVGKSLPSVLVPSYPQNVVSFGSAAPSAGEWARGDRVIYSSPSAGGAEGVVCTTAGTPGTWKTFGSIAA